MSTIDPQVRSAQRAAQGFGVSGWLLLFAFLAAWILAGVASTWVFFEPFRRVTANPDTEFFLDPDAGYMIFVPTLFIALGCILGVLLMRPLGYVPMGDTLRGPLPTALAFASTGVGCAFFWIVLAVLAPADHAPQGVLQWITATMPIWLPVLLVIVATLIVGIPVGRKRRRANIRSARTRTVGVVTAKEYTRIAMGGGEGSVGDPIVKVTLKFTDAQGTERWVTKRVAYYRAGSPNVGTRLPLYYDSERPESTRRILVDFPF